MQKLLLSMIIFFCSIIVNGQSDFAVGLSGSVNFPNGKFTKYFNTGFGGDAHFLYLLGNYSILSFTVGYNRFDLDQNAFNDKAKEMGIDAQFDIESSFAIIPILLGAKYYFLQQKNSSPYIMIEAGLYNYKFSFKGTATTEISGGNNVLIDLKEVDETGTQTMLRISAGYIIFFSKHWFMDSSVGYIVLTNAFAVNEPSNPDDPEAIYGVVGTLNYISTSLGINYRF